MEESHGKNSGHWNTEFRENDKIKLHEVDKEIQNSSIFSGNVIINKWIISYGAADTGFDWEKDSNQCKRIDTCLWKK